jgi:formylglycine-generating enzyme required for sulfatase activity
MADKPVNFVNWFDAARVSNWLHNGGNTGADTEIGAYSLSGATTGVFSKNIDSRFWIPSENEWYKAAYYMGGSLSAGYWRFPTQSNTLGSAYKPDSQGDGSRLAINQSVANYNDFMKWGLPTDGYGNVTTVGLNGAPSAYGTFDMAGNVYEMTDTLDAGSRIIRGGSYFSPSGPFFQTHVSRDGRDFGGISEGSGLGFRIAAVPEPSTYAMAFAGLGCGGYSMWRRRKRA